MLYLGLPRCLPRDQERRKEADTDAPFIMDIMTFFTKCHATLVALWSSERSAEEWRTNIEAPIGASLETTPCVGRNQEAPV